jgi:hydrogenase maturation factor
MRFVGAFIFLLHYIGAISLRAQQNILSTQLLNVRKSMACFLLNSVSDYGQFVLIHTTNPHKEK